MNYVILGECAKEGYAQERAALNQYYESHRRSGDECQFVTVYPEDFMYAASVSDLNMTLNRGDCVIIYRPADIVKSIDRFLAFCEYLVQRGVSLHVVTSGKLPQQHICLTPESTALDCMRASQLFNSDMISYRTTKLLAKRKSQGFTLGRPKGRKNKALKLDRHAETIDQYLKLNLGKATISKLVGCHPQTLYDWLARRTSKPQPSNVDRT